MPSYLIFRLTLINPTPHILTISRERLVWCYTGAVEARLILTQWIRGNIPTDWRCHWVEQRGCGGLNLLNFKGHACLCQDTGVPHMSGFPRLNPKLSDAPYGRLSSNSMDHLLPGRVDTPTWGQSSTMVEDMPQPFGASCPLPGCVAWLSTNLAQTLTQKVADINIVLLAAQLKLAEWTEVI